MSRSIIATQQTQTILVVGKESVGKSQLVSSLTGRSAGETNFRGSTVVVERYRTGEHRVHRHAWNSPQLRHGDDATGTECARRERRCSVGGPSDESGSGLERHAAAGCR